VPTSCGYVYILSAPRVQPTLHLLLYLCCPLFSSAVTPPTHKPFASRTPPGSWTSPCYFRRLAPSSFARGPPSSASSTIWTFLSARLHGCTVRIQHSRRGFPMRLRRAECLVKQPAKAHGAGAGRGSATQVPPPSRPLVPRSDNTESSIFITSLQRSRSLSVPQPSFTSTPLFCPGTGLRQVLARARALGP